MAIFINKPVIIAIAGSTNKNFTKREIRSRLKEMGVGVRANPKNFNTEIGMPLAILDLPSGYNEYKKWLPTIFKAPLKVFEKDFPEFLILTLGTSDEGDMQYLLSIITPRISVITDITQRYREGFSDMNNLVKEYGTLIEKTEKEGILILNRDNYRIKELGDGTDKKTVYFGFDEKSDIRIVDNEKTEVGQKIRLRSEKSDEVRDINRFGKHHAYAFAIGQIVEQEIKKDPKIRVCLATNDL